MDELLDMITKDESPSGISDAIKDALYAKSAEKIGAHKNAVAASLFGDPKDGLDYKSDYEWTLNMDNGDHINIYDWKIGKTKIHEYFGCSFWKIASFNCSKNTKGGNTYRNSNK